MDYLRLLTACGILWAVAALTGQVITARRGEREDFSRPAGSAARGVWYNFTTAMLPWRKEAARLHPGILTLGLIMHAGALFALAEVIILVVAPAIGERLLTGYWPVNLVALVAGGGLLARRVGSGVLRSLSDPDDYLAIIATCGLLGLSAAFPLAAGRATPLLAYSTLLFLYFPLGKLRHAVFFFLARAHYGRRLGLRGVYPPAEHSMD